MALQNYVTIHARLVYADLLVDRQLVVDLPFGFYLKVSLLKDNCYWFKILVYSSANGSL